MHVLYCFSLSSDDPYYPIRLMGDNDNEGCVQYFYDNTWGSFCHLNLTGLTPVANVMCRTLGFPSADSVSHCSVSSGDSPVWLSDVTCTGDESSIMECSLGKHGIHSCEGHTHDIAVTCKGLQTLYTGHVHVHVSVTFFT